MITLPKLLDNSLNEVRRLYPITLSITENIIPLSTASMSLPKDQRIPDRSYVELFTPNGSAGIFRTRTPESHYSSLIESYSLEHAICEVGDWLVRANINSTKKTLTQALTQVFNYYGGTRWQLGTVCAGDVVISANYSNLLQTMNSLIAQVQDAYMTFDFSTTPWTINVALMSDTVSAEGRLSRNIESASIRRDDTQLCTRVYLSGLNGGKMDADTIETYGVVEKRLSGEYTRTNAEKIAGRYLERYSEPLYTVTINGADFSSITGETLDRMILGKLYRLVIPEDNITLIKHITCVYWQDIVNKPNFVQLTLSEPETTIVSIVSNNYSSYYGAGGDYEQQEKKNEEFTSRITQTESSISLVVTGSGTSASINIQGIVDGINDPSTAIYINADKVKINGTTFVDDVYDTLDGLITGVVTATNLHTLGLTVYDSMVLARNNVYWNFGVDQIVINGTTYNVVTATQVQPQE